MWQHPHFQKEETCQLYPLMSSLLSDRQENAQTPEGGTCGAAHSSKHGARDGARDTYQGLRKGVVGAFVLSQVSSGPEGTRPSHHGNTNNTGGQAQSGALRQAHEMHMIVIFLGLSLIHRKQR